MEPNTNRIAAIASLIICLLISVPLGYGYFFTDWRQPSFSRDTGQVVPEFQEDSRIIDGRILLKKDKSITVNRSRLLFKGMEEDRIRLDVYLLELDPEYAYPHYISKTDTGKILHLGDSSFKLIKINRDVLQLKLLDLYKS